MTFPWTQRYRCVAIPAFNAEGNLPAGVHWARWNEFSQRFGATAHRRRLLQGIKRALDALEEARCRRVYIGGSFVTAKRRPRDFDACWDIAGVKVHLLDPVLLKFDDQRAAQKAKYKGELFPAQWTGSVSGRTFLGFFQVDKETGAPKGIVGLELRRGKP